MANERLYIVAYDISEPKRWRRVYKLMKGYGHWLQLSIFQCRLTARRRAEMSLRLEESIERTEDHVLIVDMGPADAVDPWWKVWERPMKRQLERPRSYSGTIAGSFANAHVEAKGRAALASWYLYVLQ